MENENIYNDSLDIELKNWNTIIENIPEKINNTYEKRKKIKTISSIQGIKNRLFNKLVHILFIFL